MLWASIGWYSSFILSFVFSLVTARLLTPAEFGLIGMVLVIVVVAQLFADSGTRAALVHREGDDLSDAVSTAMVSVPLAGFAGSCIIAACSTLIASFYREPRLVWIAFTMSWLLFIFSLSIVPDALLQRRLDLRIRRAVVDPLSIVGYGVTVIVLALAGLGPWALVIGQFVSFTIITAGAWWLAKPRFRKGRPSWAMYRSISRYGRGLLAANVVESIEAQAAPVVLGRGVDTHAVGLWQAGMRLGKLPLTGIVQVTGGVVFSALSRLKHDLPRFRAVASEALQMNSMLIVPVGVTFMTMGVPIMGVVYGRDWRDAGVVLQFIGFWAICLGLSDNGREIFKAFGRPMLVARGAAFETATAVIYLGVLWGTGHLSLWAVALGRAISGAVLACTYIVQAHRLDALRVGEQWRAVRASIGAGLVQAGVMWALHWYVSYRWPEWDVVHGFVQAVSGLGVVLAIFAVGVACYAATLWMLDREAIRRLRRNLRTSIAGRRA